jgi:serine-type D-Ala-D-Ala carboxypeptidase (penicillin-binding protein 5/6)
LIFAKACRQSPVMKMTVLTAMRLFGLACVIGLGLHSAPQPVAAQSAPAQSFQSAAPVAFLIDAASRTVLYEKSADDLIAPASLAKIMTAAVIFEDMRLGRLKNDDEFIISENAWRKGGAISSGSSMFAQLNSKVKVSDLVQGLIVQSGNDAAIALAEGISGRESVFAERMTQRAKELGLTKLTFRNATGMADPAQRVTAREMAKLALHVIETYPEQYRIFGQREFTWNKIRQLNRNPLLTMDIGADGLKTGQIEESGFALAASAVQDGQRLVLVISGLKTARDRGLEARKLLEWGFRSFEERKLLKQSEAVGDIRVFGGAKGSVSVGPANPVSLLTARGTADRITARIIYNGPLKAPVEKGTEVARLRITRAEISALDVPLVALETVEQGSLTQRALDSAMELSGGWFRKILSKVKDSQRPS